MSELNLKFNQSIEYDLLIHPLGNVFHNQYNILDKIHQGIMSQVFVIMDRQSGELFIMKVIDLDHKFCAIDLMLKINHTHIAKVYTSFETDKYMYIIKEYVRGSSLEELVKQSGPFTGEVVLEISTQLCQILNYLHSFDTSPAIYRDLKPSNLIMDEDGDIKLIDTDSIRHFKEKGNKDTVFIGTEGFAPPEQY